MYDLKNGVPICPQCGRQVSPRRAQCRACGYRYAAKGSVLGGLVKLVLLLFIGLVILGALSSMGRAPAVQPVPVVAESPPVELPVRVAPIPQPVARFGLTEERRFEANNARWQAGMWAVAEANQLYPLSSLKDDGTDRDLIAKRHTFYEARKTLALALVAKKYGVEVDVLDKIGEEGDQKKWNVSPTPVLFDQGEAGRAVLISKTGVDPTREDAVKLRAFEERQRAIELRKEKRIARRANQP